MSKELKARLSSLLLTDSMSDITFLVDDPPIRCPAHRLVLGLRSRVFRAMFYGSIAEKNEVRVPDVTQKGFIIMLKYLYSDAIALECELDAFEAAYASKKYMVHPLFRSCENYLLRNITLNPKNVFSIHEEATFLEMRHLQDRCLRFISRNARKVFRSEYFTSASKSTVQDILSMDVMDLDSEVQIIEAVWNWGTEQCKDQGVKATAENVQNVTQELVSRLRFLSVKMEDLEKVLEKCEILDTSDQLTVLWNAAMLRDSNATPQMPKNLCTIARTRSLNNCSLIDLPTAYRYQDDLMMTACTVDRRCIRVNITVTGPVTILGAIAGLCPLSCYSPYHRTFDLDLQVANETTGIRSGGTCFIRAEKKSSKDIEMQVLLEEYVAVRKGETATVTVCVSAEGVRLKHCLKSQFQRSCGLKTNLNFRFDTEESERILFPLKQLMCIAN